MGNKQQMDRLELTAGKLPMFLGLAKAERQTFQWVDWHIVFEFDSEVCGKSGNLSDSIDYVTALGEMKFLLWVARFYLLETAVNFIAEYFLQRYPSLLRIEVAASKKEALKEFCHPTLKVVRDQSSKQREVCKVIDYPDLQCVAGKTQEALAISKTLGGDQIYALALLGSSEKRGKAQNLSSTGEGFLEGVTEVLICKPLETAYPSTLIESFPLARNRPGENASVDNLFEISFFNPVLHTYVK